MAAAPRGPCCGGALSWPWVSTPDTSPLQTHCAEGWVPCQGGFVSKHLSKVERDRRREFYSWICHKLCNFGQDFLHLTGSVSSSVRERVIYWLIHLFYPELRKAIKHLLCIDTWSSDRLWRYEMHRSGLRSPGACADGIIALVLYPALYLILPFGVWFGSPSL